MDETQSVLVERARRGDSQAWEELWKQFHPVAYALAYGRLRDRSLADDVSQEAFRVAIEKLDGLDDVRRFPGWLRTITLNLATKHGQKKQAAYQLQDASHAEIPDGWQEGPISDGCVALLLPVLKQVMPRLSAMHQTIVNMSFLQGMTDTAIAPIVQRNNGTVGRARDKALAMLKVLMREASVEHPDARECIDHLAG